MNKRRENGTGHIYLKSNGKWGGMFPIGYNSQGKPRYTYFTAKSKQEVSSWLVKLQAEKAKGINIAPNKMLVGEWLDYWYENHCVNKVKDTTRADDESIIRNHLKPNFGRIKLSDLKGYQVQEVYNNMLKSGKMNSEQGGLSPKTIRNIHVVFHRALNQACKSDLLIKNPLISVTLPRVHKTPIEILTPEEQKALEQKCSNHLWGTAILLTLYSGMRLGEVLGLTWDDIDFKNGTIRINKQLSRVKNFNPEIESKTILILRLETKTKSSNRIICIAPAVMEKLKSYKTEQEANRQKIKSVYNDLNMVFCRSDGWYIDPKTFGDFYTNTLKKAGVGHKTFHALRHTFATRALEAGTPPKVVSEILGHSSVQITLDTYSHVSQELQSNFMQRIADKFLVA